MKLNAELLGFLNLVVLTYSRTSCQKEEKQIWYYIYKTNLEIKTYYCFHNPKSDFSCNSFFNAKKVIVNSAEIFRYCSSETAIKSSGKNMGTENIFCELPAHVDLIKGTIKLADNMTCPYEDGFCENTNLAKRVFWKKKDVCQRLLIIYKNNFNIWTSRQYQTTKFIQDKHISLLLTENITFCRVEMWKTNHEGIIVSEDNATTLETQIYPPLNSIPPKGCNIQMNPMLLPKTWYLYKYPTNVTVYFCLTHSQDSCENQSLGKTASKNNSNLLKQCTNYFNSPFDASQVMLCEKSLKIDFERDQVLGLSSDCTYSSGQCRTNKGFWDAKNQCGVLHKVINGYEDLCNNTKCIINNGEAIKFDLIKEGHRCGEIVWYSDQEGLLISEKNLHQHLKTENKGGSIKDAIYKHRKEIRSVQSFLNYIILLLLLCAAWYVFNVIINVCSLLKSKKRQPAKGKTYLMNCVSQSLTVRYLQLHRQEQSAPKPIGVRQSNIYASVNNELYQSANTDIQI